MARIYDNTGNVEWGVFVDLTENSYSIENNTSSVTGKLYLYRKRSASYYGGVANVSLTIDGSTQSGSFYPTYPTNIGSGTNNAHLVKTFSYTVSHNNDGSKTASVSFSWSANFSPNNVSGSGSFTLTTIPRASSISVSNYNLGQNIGVIIGKKSNSFTSTLSYSIGSRTGNIVTKTSSSNYAWTMEGTLINQIKQDNPSTRNVSATIYCETYNGNTKIGSTQSATFTLSIVDKPTISNVVREELNNNISLLTSKVLKSASQNQFTITASAPVGTSISSYKVVNGSQSNSSSNNILTLNDIQEYNSNTMKTTFKITCTDGRGNTSNEYILEEDFINYVNVSVNKTDTKITRTNSVTNDGILYLTGNFYNGLIGETQNSLDISYKYREQGTGTYSNLENLSAIYSNNTFKIENITINGNFDYKKNYEFVFYIVDEINNLNVFEYIYTSSKPIEIHHSNGAYIRNVDTDVLTSGNGDGTFYNDATTIVQHNGMLINSRAFSSTYLFAYLHRGEPAIMMNDGSDYTSIFPYGITTPSVTQTSQSEKKKNFTKLDNALEILKKTDIYKYNLKREKDTEKKSIGFVIGKEFNYSEEITSKDNKGANIYSMVSVLWQVVKEQQEKIEEMEMKINGIQ